MLGDQEKRKERKSQKSRNEEKVAGFSSASLFPGRKWEAVTHLMWRRTQGAGIIKG